MEAWEQLVWDRPPETDAHRDAPRNPNEYREVQAMHADLRTRKLRITDFLSQHAIGDNQACSLELLIRSRRLIEESRAQIVRLRMRLLMRHFGKPVQ